MMQILLITHGDVGNALMQAAEQALGQLPLPMQVVKVQQDVQPDHIITELRPITQALKAGDGLLILTDIYGATPSNIAVKLQNSQQIRVITGLNLPMLIRVLNYPTLSLDELAAKAVSGGKDGIILCNEETGC
jgi:PTS system mannose-specific IIA component